jgi:hypothetical protein
MRKFSTRSIAIASMALAGLTLVSSNIYLAAGIPSQINGCVNKKTQVLRIAEKCNASETKISWSVQGPTGPAGPKGETGSAGASSPVSATVPFHQVLDAKGKVLGNFLGATGEDTTIQIGLARVTYNLNGNIRLNGNAVYLDDKCAGDKYAGSSMDLAKNWTPERPLFTNDDSMDVTREFFVGIQTGEALSWQPYYMKRSDTGGAGIITCMGPFDIGGDSQTISPKMYKLSALKLDISPIVAVPLVIK